MTRRRPITPLFAALYLLQVMLLVIWHMLSSNADRPDRIAMTILTAALTGGIDLLSAHLLRRAIDQTERAHATREAEELERSLQAYSNMAEQEARMVASISLAVEHELALARETLSCGRPGEVSAHMQAGLDLASEAYSLQHGNIVIAAVLEAQRRRCDTKGIRLNADVALPAEVGIPDIELGTMVLSLIDYIRESCEQANFGDSDKREINVRMLADLGQLVIEVEGPITKNRSTRRWGREQAFQTKGSIAVVKEISERYGGIIDLEDKGRMRRVAVMLSMNEDHASLIQADN